VQDLGHLVHKTHLHVNFVGLLMQEFFTQGDLLEQEGAPVMSMFRRTDDLMTIARGQCSFFEYIALPFFGSFTEVRHDSPTPRRANDRTGPHTSR
jgi:hypothetical protein